MASTPAAKDRITCHVLDTTTGKPARVVRVQLELVTTNASAASPTSASAGPAPDHHKIHKTFESHTDDDGRIKVWLPYSASNAAGEVPVYTLDDVLSAVESEATAGPSTWTLRFDTEGYFGGADKTFFPEVAVTFRVAHGQHYHVPLLLSPYSYTTYRGS